MKKFMQKLLSVIIFVFLISACGTQYMAYESEAYRLEYPQNWRKFDNAAGNLQDVDLVLMLLDQDKNMRASLSVMLNENILEISELEDYIKKDIEAFVSMSGYEKIKLEKVEIDGVKTFLHNFKALDDDGEEKRFIQTYLPSAEVFYILTASLPANPENNLLVEVRRIMKSFKFTVNNN